tara:strand:+ start:251 stop:385 length:135 start_codon:yes stop_codon:yes gene_type:complete
MFSIFVGNTKRTSTVICHKNFSFFEVPKTLIEQELEAYFEKNTQ